MKKTYISKVSKNLEIHILVRGYKKLISFSGGTINPPMNGTYTTDDPETIKALDSDSANGILFTCLTINGLAPKTWEAKKEKEKLNSEEMPAEETMDAPMGSSEKEVVATQEKKSVEEVPGINSLQEARNYLLKRINGLKPSKIPNAVAVKNLAKEHGLIFPDLK